MKITKEFIEKGVSNEGGYTKQQLAILGVAWPPKTGWKNRCVGKTITDNKAKEFLGVNKQRALQPLEHSKQYNNKPIHMGVLTIYPKAVVGEFYDPNADDGTCPFDPD